MSIIMQVIIDADLWINWVSNESLPAGRWGNDSTMITNEVLQQIVGVCYFQLCHYHKASSFT